MGIAIPLVGMAVGAGLSLAGRAQASHAADQAYGNQIRQQNQYRGQAAQSFGKYVPTVGAGQAALDINSGKQSREAGYAQQSAQPVAQAQAQSPVLATRDQAALGQQTNARAKLGGYQDWQMQNAIRDLHEQQEQNQIGNFASGTAKLLPLELQQASHAGDSLNAIGSLVGSLGSLAGSGLFGGGGNAGMMSPVSSSSATSAGWVRSPNGGWMLP